MKYSPNLGSPITNTFLRNGSNVADISGMCAVCTSDCYGPCEIGHSAIRGAEVIMPFLADKNHFASEKKYPLDFSHFNINGHVFGTKGIPEDPYLATFTNVDIHSTFGKNNIIKIKAPFIMPAIAKLAWKEYFAGAALAGVPAVIGEDVIARDSRLITNGHRVQDSPLLNEMINSYRQFQSNFGDIILQANYDDEYHGVLEYAIEKHNIKSVELKFGQAAKGIQGVTQISDILKAKRYKELGYIILPDPEDHTIIEAYNKGIAVVFQKIGKLPMWTYNTLMERISELRSLGVERICFKIGPYDPYDLVKILKIASAAQIDLVTFDGAGGGTGHSPAKMMNEWGIPTVILETIIYRILSKIDTIVEHIPAIAIAGGFATEDQIYKGLSLGSPYINMIAIGRAAMSAASIGKKIGETLQNGIVPKEYAAYGSKVEDVFANYSTLKSEYGAEIDKIPIGAIGLYSYINRISVGLQQFMALNRKFSLNYIERNDIIPLTDIAAKSTGLSTYEELLNKAIDDLC